MIIDHTSTIMRFAIRHGGSGYAAVNVQLKKGETVKAESDAMVTKSQHVDIGKSIVCIAFAASCLFEWGQRQFNWSALAMLGMF